MKYSNIETAVFLERPNRFIAYVERNGKKEKVHVKNTGRCEELLKEGAEVYLEKSSNPNRSTAYDLVAVKKGKRIVNMDSAAPNLAAGEWLRAGGLYPDTEEVRAERTFGKSRFDFYVRTSQKEIWMEVKGVNLEIDNRALFPDAPSLRAQKHVEELIEAAKQGYEAVLLFVVQMEGIKWFEPNRQTQPEFADALIRAREAGVKILARGCTVTADSMEISCEIPVCLKEDEAEIPVCLKKKEAEERLRDRTPVLENIAPGLLKWYDENRRILPWREDPAPYRVWVSEIMLQQTRVEAVKPYFQRFMERFPDIAALAEAPDDVLLKMWEGLGYYNRAHNLKKAAGEIMERFCGVMPSGQQELLSLSGIGSYTAGAIASIAYGIPVPAVDGNVLRVLSRYRADDRDMSNAKIRKSIESELAEIIPGERPGDFNQALMELGATVCLPNGIPKCDECPLNTYCLAHRQGREVEFPGKKEKGKRTIEERTILVIRDENRAAIRKRSGKGLLAGMYELPSLDGRLTGEEVLHYLKEKGLSVVRISALPDAKHIFSHKEWHMSGYLIKADELEPYRGEWDGLIFAETAKTEEEYPIPAAFSAYAGYLGIRIGNQKYEGKGNSVKE